MSCLIVRDTWWRIGNRIVGIDLMGVVHCHHFVPRTVQRVRRPCRQRRFRRRLRGDGGTGDTYPTTKFDVLLLSEALRQGGSEQGAASQCVSEFAEQRAPRYIRCARYSGNSEVSVGSGTWAEPPGRNERPLRTAPIAPSEWTVMRSTLC